MNGQQKILEELLEIFPFTSKGSSFYDRFQNRALRDVEDLVHSKDDSLYDLRDKANRLMSSVSITLALNPGVTWHTNLPTSATTTTRVHEAVNATKSQRWFLTEAEQGEHRKKQGPS